MGQAIHLGQEPPSIFVKDAPIDMSILSVPPISTADIPGPPPSWLEQTTNLFGVDIPNWGLAAGGGLLVLTVAMKGRR